jgi:hypothetical protein
MLVAVLVLPAVMFALAYAPITTYLARGLVSAYAKADLNKRFGAAVIDALVAITLWVLFRRTGVALSVALAAAFLLLRDAIGGQSVGKALLGLTVINLHTARPGSVVDSVKRNCLLLLPGANVAGLFLETRTVIQDPQGQRLGDRLAHTQVVDGLGAKDFVTSFQEWLVGLGVTAGRVAGQRRPLPGRIDRAA